jgi:hypothetical protein
MGGGMMMMDCVACDGTGEVSDIVKPEVAPVTVAVIDRRGKTYKEAVMKIMDLHRCSKDEAVQIFDEEFSKLPE